MSEIQTIIQSTPCRPECRQDFLSRLATGRLTRAENPASHFSTFFAVYDPAQRLVFIGHHRKADLWLFNGGHLEPDETPAQAVQREVKEELGFDIKLSQIGHPRLLTTADITPTVRTCRKHYDIWFFIPFDSQNFHADQKLLATEFLEWGWKTLDQARQLTHDPAMGEALDEIERAW